MNFDSNQRYWIIIWSMLLSTVCIIVISGCIYNYKVTSEAIKAGLEETYIQGTARVLWTKPVIKTSEKNEN